MSATNEQVQQFVDERVRPRAEQLRAIYLAVKDDQQAIDDVYANVSDNSTWVDDRTDHPPHLLTPSDVLSYNAFIVELIALIESGAGAAHWPIIQSACVRSL